MAIGDEGASVSRGPTWVRDELILACDLVYENGWKGLDDTDQRIQELSALLQKLPIHPLDVRGPKFRNTNGVARKTYDLATRHPNYQGVPTKGGAGDVRVLQDFLADGPKMHRIAEAIRVGVKSGDLIDSVEELDDVDELESEAPEGRLLERRHFVRERDHKKRQEKIKKHLAENNGKLACETCRFDFGVTYGEHGDGYIECHHIVPLHASGETTTRLDDLILICSNCHRMIHRRSPWLNPDELRTLLNQK